MPNPGGISGNACGRSEGLWNRSASEGAKQQGDEGCNVPYYWYPDSRSVVFGALINIRPRQGNMGMEIQDIRLREQVEAVVRHLLEG